MALREKVKRSNYEQQQINLTSLHLPSQTLPCQGYKHTHILYTHTYTRTHLLGRRRWSELGNNLQVYRRPVMNRYCNTSKSSAKHGIPSEYFVRVSTITIALRLHAFCMDIVQTSQNYIIHLTNFKWWYHVLTVKRELCFSFVTWDADWGLTIRW